MRSVTPKDKVAALKAVTPRFARDNQHRFEEGMSDAEIETALKDQFGNFGSRGAEDFWDRIGIHPNLGL